MSHGTLYEIDVSPKPPHHVYQHVQVQTSTDEDMTTGFIFTITFPFTLPQINYASVKDKYVGEPVTRRLSSTCNSAIDMFLCKCHESVHRIVGVNSAHTWFEKTDAAAQVLKLCRPGAEDICCTQKAQSSLPCIGHLRLLAPSDEQLACTTQLLDTCALFSLGTRM